MQREQRKERTRTFHWHYCKWTDELKLASAVTLCSCIGCCGHILWLAGRVSEWWRLAFFDSVLKWPDLDGFEWICTWGQEEVKAEDEEEEQVAAEDMFWAWQVGASQPFLSGFSQFPEAMGTTLACNKSSSFDDVETSAFPIRMGSEWVVTCVLV